MLYSIIINNLIFNKIYINQILKTPTKWFTPTRESERVFLVIAHEGKKFQGTWACQKEKQKYKIGYPEGYICTNFKSKYQTKNCTNYD